LEVGGHMISESCSHDTSLT